MNNHVLWRNRHANSIGTEGRERERELNSQDFPCGLIKVTCEEDGEEQEKAGSRSNGGSTSR